MKMLRVALTALVAAAAGSAGCGGSLNVPDAGAGQRGGTGAPSGGGGAAGAEADAGIQIVDVRPPDEPCSLEAPAMPVADETCRFSIPEPPCFYANRTHIGVRVGSGDIPRDPTGQDGWDYSDSSQTMITIYGPSCDAVTGGAGVTILYKIILP